MATDGYTISLYPKIFIRQYLYIKKKPSATKKARNEKKKKNPIYENCQLKTFSREIDKRKKKNFAFRL